MSNYQHSDYKTTHLYLLYKESGQKVILDSETSSVRQLRTSRRIFSEAYFYMDIEKVKLDQRAR